MAYKKNKLQKTRILQVKQPCKKTTLVVNSFLSRIHGFGRENVAKQRALGLCFLEQRPKTTYMLLQSYFPALLAL